MRRVDCCFLVCAECFIHNELFRDHQNDINCYAAYGNRLLSHGLGEIGSLCSWFHHASAVYVAASTVLLNVSCVIYI